MHILLELCQSLSPSLVEKVPGATSSFSAKKPMGQFLTAQDLAGIMIRLGLNSSLAILPGSAIEQRPQRVISGAGVSLLLILELTALFDPVAIAAA